MIRKMIQNAGKLVSAAAITGATMFVVPSNGCDSGQLEQLMSPLLDEVESMLSQEGAAGDCYGGCDYAGYDDWGDCLYD